MLNIVATVEIQNCIVVHTMLQKESQKVDRKYEEEGRQETLSGHRRLG
jgi:hypothetical protein